MNKLVRFVAGAGVGTLALLTLSATAGASPGPGSGRGPDHGFPGFGQHAVFAQTNDPAHNAVLTYSRRGDGTLAPAGSYATGGRGGVAPGAVVDPIASQGSVTYDASRRLLLVTNAGSDSMSVFRVDGTRLSLLQVLPSGGAFPVSVTVHGDLVYVLDAGADGAVQGYRFGFRGLTPIEHRRLGLANTNPPFFTAGPGQVGFTPDGGTLLVTTKSNQTVDAFPVRWDGRLGTLVANPATGTVPFAFSFDGWGRLVVVEAGTSSASTHLVTRAGTLRTLSGPLTDGQQAACWVTVAGQFAYVANAGSSTISTYRIGWNGTLTLSPTVTPTSGGPIDLLASPDGRYVYSENGGAGTIDELRVGSDGRLTRIGTVTGLAAHTFEGIAAS